MKTSDVSESFKIHINQDGIFRVQFVAGWNSKIRFTRLIGTDAHGKEKVFWIREMADRERNKA